MSSKIELDFNNRLKTPPLVSTAVSDRPATLAPGHSDGKGA